VAIFAKRPIESSLPGIDTVRSGAGSPGFIVARCAGLAIGTGLPVAMTIGNKSAPVLLGTGALLACVAAVLSGRGAELWARTRLVAHDPVVGIAAAAIVLSVSSLAWSIDPALTLRGLMEGAPELLATLGLAIAWPIVFREKDSSYLFFGIAVAALLIGLERFGHMELHRALGQRGYASDLKRSAVPLALLLWPALSSCLAARRFLLGVSLLLCVIAAVLLAHSGASMFGLIAAGSAFAIARFAPAFAFGATACLLVVLAVGSGWAGTSARQGLAVSLVDGLHSVHAAQRIRIWRAFERRVFERPLLGHGFNSSQGVAPDILPEDMTPDRSTPSLAHVHPHSMFLQLWIELGVVGIAGALGILMFLLDRIRRCGDRLSRSRLALFAAVISIGLVSMSPWQPWWLATIAASLLWFHLVQVTGAQDGRQPYAPARSRML
jgi:exopolysaccharide production protein ExoQ